MAGDLEEFLKRAAERRAKKQGGGGGRPAGRAPNPTPTQQPQAERERPGSLRDRHLHSTIDEAIPVAEVVEPVNPLAEQQRKLAESRKRAEEAKKKLEKVRRSQRSEQQDSVTPAPMPDGTPAEQLIEMLRRPQGLQQAFLLREILDRRTDRY